LLTSNISTPKFVRSFDKKTEPPNT